MASAASLNGEARALSDALSTLEKNASEVGANFQQFLHLTATSLKEVTAPSLELMNVMHQSATNVSAIVDSGVMNARSLIQNCQTLHSELTQLPALQRKL